jgi:Protein of unknown function (DUF3455)
VTGKVTVVLPLRRPKTFRCSNWRSPHSGGRGQITGPTTIQGINTKGGTAEGACEASGAFESMPYSADYTFLTKGG